jgi:mannose-6-phosphate isomerase-like protein (cupin superfamily)
VTGTDTMGAMKPLSIPTALATFTEEWQPRRLATVNDHDVKIARISGDFVWHSHPNSDELFLVVAGHLTIGLREAGVESRVELHPEDLFVVPAGVQHCPSATPETVIVMVEKVGTVNTGDTGGDRTAALQELDPVS